MKLKHNIIIGGSMLLICAYLLWTQRSVTILRAGERFEYESTLFNKLYVSSKRGFIDFETYDIAVNHFALTEWGRIHWYLQNKNELKVKYSIPTSASYHIVFWDVGGGFIDGEISSDGDLICFPPQKNTIENCIEKKLLLTVDFDEGSYERFSFGNSDYYWITMPDGKLVRIKRAL
jgi:hypothetical protein